MFTLRSYPKLGKKNLKFEYRNQYQQLTDDLVRLLPKTELLNGEIFYSLKEAHIVIEQWRKHFNTVRPHSSLGYRPPAPQTFKSFPQLDQSASMQ